MISVLIVDDERITRDGLSSAIQWSEYGFIHPRCAGSAYDALELIEESIPDIVIADIRMPEMDGIELLKIIRRNYPGIRVILISGYDEFEYAQAAISARAFSYILKPIDNEVLMKSLFQARDEILLEKQQVEEDTDLRNRFERWIPTVRNNLICRLLRDAPALYDANDMQAVGIDLKQIAFRVVLFHTGERSSSSDSRADRRTYRDYAVLDKAVELWQLPATCYAFDCIMYTGLFISGSSDTDDAIAVFSSLRTWANQTVDLALTVGIGPEVHSIERISASFSGAERAMDARICAGRNNVIVSDRLLLTDTVHNATQVFGGILQSMESNVLNAIRANDTDRLAQIVAEMADELKRILERCIDAKNRLLHQVVGFLMKVHLSADLDIPSDGFLACTRVESTDQLKSVGMEILEHSIDAWQQKQSAHVSYIVKRAVEYLHQNIGNDISLTRVADALSVHPNYLSSIFKSTMGKRFIDYEREVKIDEAKRLLKDTTMKVYEIAAAVQYQDVNHFTRIFKQIIGCSPTEYRDLQ